MPQLLAQVFAEADVLDRLTGFTSTFAARWYQLPQFENPRTLTLIKQPWLIPERVGGFALFKASEKVPWSAQEDFEH